jgi:hypothetical protein
MECFEERYRFNSQASPGHWGAKHLSGGKQGRFQWSAVLANQPMLQKSELPDKEKREAADFLAKRTQRTRMLSIGIFNGQITSGDRSMFQPHPEDLCGRMMSSKRYEGSDGK